MDITNKLILSTQPQSKEVTDRIESEKFSLQLSTDRSARKAPIYFKQSELRLRVSELRQIERTQYQYRKALNDEVSNDMRAE